MENNLNEYNIFALRNLARQTGVRSPTSKKKDVLIKEILDIRSGKQTPQTDEKRQGRPPKTFGYDMSNAFDFITEECSAVPMLSLKQQEPSLEQDELVMVSGVLELVNNNAGILWTVKNYSVEKYFVPADVMAKNNLKMGDRIVGKTTGDENQKIITSLLSVNDIPIAYLKNKRQDYSQIERIMLNKKLNFKDNKFKALNLLQGENYYFYGANNNYNTLALVELFEALECDNKIYINVMVAEKTKLLLKNLHCLEMYTCGAMDSVDVSRRLVTLAIERVKRILEVKENVAIFVDDLLSISGVDNETTNLVKNLVSLAGETCKHGSITLFAVMPDHSLVQIEKLADGRFEIDGKEIIRKS